MKSGHRLTLAGRALNKGTKDSCKLPLTRETVKNHRSFHALLAPEAPLKEKSFKSYQATQLDKR